jgi:hypothetical protein
VEVEVEVAVALEEVDVEAVVLAAVGLAEVGVGGLVGAAVVLAEAEATAGTEAAIAEEAVSAAARPSREEVEVCHEATVPIQVVASIAVQEVVCLEVAMVAVRKALAAIV